MNTFYDSKGRPATAADYKFEMAEGVVVDEGLLAFGRNLFHKVGLNPVEAQTAMDDWNEFAAAQNVAAADVWREGNDKAIATFRASKGEGYQAFIDAGSRVVQAAGLSNDIIAGVEAHMGTAPLLEMLGAIGSASKEGTLLAANNGVLAQGGALDAGQVEAEIARLNADPAFKTQYHTANDPGHKAAVDKMSALYARKSQLARG
ncbi:MAG: hypothetical protein KAR40_15315 [Candidatus Sabulitectum sp.]|nr:hypothetical protein [Candidatus Sabulitectum sp.]